MTRIGIQSSRKETEFFPVLRSGHGRALPGRDGFNRALGDARADSDEAQEADAALDDALWQTIKAFFGNSDSVGRATIPDGYSIVVELSSGGLSVFRGGDELQAVESFAEGVLVASDHEGSPPPSGP